jgi:HEAT repeat protein
MEVSPHIVYLSAAAVAAVLVSLGLLTTTMNVHRSWRDRRTTKRLAALRPRLLAALDGDTELVLRPNRAEQSAFILMTRSLLPTLRGADRERLTELLEQAGVIDVATEDLRSRSALRRARAADLLGAAAVASCVPDLVRLLNDRDADVRRIAARSLGLIGSAAAAPALLDRIEGPRSVPLNTITMALLRLDRDALEPLVDGLREGTFQVRAVCAELLGLRGSIAALPQLVAALGRREALEVRLRAARALGRIGAPSAVDPLAEAMRGDEPVALRAVATRALGQIGGPRTVSLLREALDAPEHVVATNAARALAAVSGDGTEVLVHVAGELTSRRGAYAREGLSYLALTASAAVGS